MASNSINNMHLDQRVTTQSTRQTNSRSDTANFCHRSSKRLKRHYEQRPKLLTIRQLHAKCQVKKTRIPIDLKQYLEETLHVSTDSKHTQADIFFPREPPKPFLPPKVGQDVEIQVDVSELFNFNKEVEPLLAACTNKILERALREVRQEEVLKALRTLRKELEEVEYEEEMRVRALEHEAKIQFEEHAKKIQESNKLKKAAALCRKKVAALGCAKEYLRNCGNIVDILDNARFFPDPTESIIDIVNQQTQDKIQWETIAKELTDELITMSTEISIVNRRRGCALLENQEKRRTQRSKSGMRLVIHGGEQFGPIGPIKVVLTCTVADIKVLVEQWIKRNHEDKFGKKTLSVQLLQGGKKLKDKQVLKDIDFKKGDLDMQIDVKQPEDQSDTTTQDNSSASKGTSSSDTTSSN